jgi:Uma2 family endonuclease
MSDPYDELIEGEICLRLAPSPRHEDICQRLHERISAAAAGVPVARLLAPRSAIQISRENKVCPDLALVTAANNKLWLAAEIVNSGDHHPDTVLKKSLYEEIKIPRLWMIDPRYDNVEVYHGTPHGLALKEILALQDVLREPLLPSFAYVIAELFRA